MHGSRAATANAQDNSGLSQPHAPDYSRCFSELSRACPPLMLSGRIRQIPADFVVDETLGFTLSNNGEHHYLRIEKANLNTTEIAEKLAAYSGVPLRDVSYSGLKDKRAVTSQWFSVQLPGKPLQAIDWKGIESMDWREGNVCLKNCCLHNRKLRRGAHTANTFKITVRNLENHSRSRDTDMLREALIKRTERITAQGFPNYFGEQRFGFDGSNLNKAITLLDRKGRVSRNKKSLYLSSVRSFLFNELLNERVKLNNWNTYQRHDRLVLNGSNSFFTPEVGASYNANSENKANCKNSEHCENNDSHQGSDSNEIEAIAERLQNGDLHIGGALFGQVNSDSDKRQRFEYNSLERNIFDRFPQFTGLVEKHRIERAVRPLRALPTGLKASLNDSCDRLTLEFSLPAGSYATALLREFGVFSVDPL